MTGDIDMSSNRIIRLSSPEGPYQPTTKEYVDDNFIH